MSNRDPYVPVMHSSWTDHWRVPLWVEADTYRLCLGKDYYRHYTDDTLPKQIRSSLAMINAFPANDIPMWEVNPISAYINTQDPKLDTIGWRVGRYLYIIVMSGEIIYELKGG
jgi:hypothetical protein